MLLDKTFNPKDIKLTLIEYEGSLVPEFIFKSEIEMQKIAEILRNEGAEVLNTDTNVFIVYTKLYTDEEMFENSVEAFHKGYNIRTFFEKFKEFLPLIDPENYENVKIFLSEEENIEELIASSRKKI